MDAAREATRGPKPVSSADAPRLKRPRLGPAPALAAILAAAWTAASASPAIAQGAAWEEAARPKTAFREVWAYLMKGEEDRLAADAPITDLCVFGAEVNAYGELTNVPEAAAYAAMPGRKHLVIAEIGSYSLTHFMLDPAFPLRDAIIRAFVDAAGPFDGLQIDFEAIPSRDRDNFADFLRLLKAGLGAKTLSVALPARFTEAGDVLGYERLAAIADRLIIMAYDEHWATSEPGPVASLEWCSKVAAYALSKIGPERLVMGLPFYGRSWIDKRLARAYRHEGIAALISESGATSISREGGTPSFSYEETVVVTVHYDDAASIASRLSMYGALGARSVAFWRIGQEDPEAWHALAIDSAGGIPPAR